MNEGPNYAGSTVTIGVAFGDNLGPDDLASAVVSVSDPTGVALVDAAALTFDADTRQWFYQWLTPADGGNRTYLIQALATGLDGSLTPWWSTVALAAPPGSTLPDQPDGVPPVSAHFLSPWCDEADIPLGRLKDSKGQPITDVNLGWMIASATNLLYTLSGRKYRSGRSRVRPCAIVPTYLSQPFLYPYGSMSGFGSAFGFGPGWAWSGTLGLGFWQYGQDLSQVVLQGPVTRVNQVILNGVPLSAGQYQVLAGRRLVLAQGVGAWPWQQNPALAIDQPGTALIDYEWGNAAPPDGRLAAAELAIELTISFSGQDPNRLSPLTLSAASEGVNQSDKAPLEYLLKDLTRIPSVDLFLRAHNPRRRRRRAVFLAPNSVQASET